jgi:hypothetical protein
MDVAGDHAADLRGALQQGGEGGAILGRQADRVEGGDAGEQRRVVHGHDRGRVVEARGEALDVEAAVVAARLRGLAEQDPVAARVQLVDAVDRRWVVVVAGQRGDGHRQRRQQLLDPRVLARRSVVGEVAGDEHGVGRRAQHQHGGDRAAERRGRARIVVGDVRIGELGEQHQPESIRLILAATDRAASPGAPAATFSPARCTLVNRWSTRSSRHDRPEGEGLPACPPRAAAAGGDRSPPAGVAVA